MRKTIYAATISILFLSACKNATRQENAMNMQSGMDMANHTMPMADAMLKDSMVQNTDINNKISKNYTPTQKNEATTPIINAYLTVKNALAKDDKNGAKDGANTLLKALSDFDLTKLTDKQRDECIDIFEDAKEQAEHIAKSPIDHQREHFESLSIDINDLITLLGTSKTLYQDFCPMAGEGKGAIWLSEIKEIKNPYLGTKMTTCGSIKKQIN